MFNIFKRLSTDDNEKSSGTSNDPQSTVNRSMNFNRFTNKSYEYLYSP